jgi:copper(I)-binding protein
MRAKYLVTIASVVMAGLATGTAMAADVQITCASVSATAVGERNAFVYLTLKNTSSDERELLKATSPLAADVSLQQTSTNAQGVTRDWPVASMDLRPGQVMTLSPLSGRHFVLEGVTEPLRVGMRVPLTLQFTGGEPPMNLMLVVRPLGEIKNRACPDA